MESKVKSVFLMEWTLFLGGSLGTWAIEITKPQDFFRERVTNGKVESEGSITDDMSINDLIKRADLSDDGTGSLTKKRKIPLMGNDYIPEDDQVKKRIKKEGSNRILAKTSEELLDKQLEPDREIQKNCDRMNALISLHAGILLSSQIPLDEGYVLNIVDGVIEEFEKIEPEASEAFVKDWIIETIVESIRDDNEETFLASKRAQEILGFLGTSLEEAFALSDSSFEDD